MSLVVIANLAVFGILIYLLNGQQRKGHTLSRLVLLGLVSGSIFGLLLQLGYGEGSSTISETLAWVDIVGKGYVGLLKMVIMPLVLVSMISAVVKLDRSGSLGKISGLTICVLLFTTIYLRLLVLVSRNSLAYPLKV
ncbi:Sodium/dicarboxylate symporter [Moritella viscosa]|nr:Sodium/dicarboxylate symporter [Moritella viscosa]